jgi:hypothetical protein
METLAKEATKWMTAIAIALFGLFLGTVREARAAEPACSQNSPMIKNQMALTYRAPCAEPAVPQGEADVEQAVTNAGGTTQAAQALWAQLDPAEPKHHRAAIGAESSAPATLPSVRQPRAVHQPDFDVGKHRSRCDQRITQFSRVIAIDIIRVYHGSIRTVFLRQF